MELPAATTRLPVTLANQTRPSILNRLIIPARYLLDKDRYIA